MAAGIATAEAARPKKGPKTLSHIEIHGQLGGGTMIKHVYSGYQHDPREYKFGEDEGDRAAAHIARHTNLPLNGRAENEENADEDDEERQSAREEKPMKGAGSRHGNARAARTEGL